MADRLERQNGSTDSGFLVNITPSDSADLTDALRMLIVGVGGDVKITDTRDVTDVTDVFTLESGNYPIRVKRVWATGTTATGLVGVI